MHSIEKRVKKYLNTAFLYAGIVALCGLVLLIFPELSLDVIRWGLTISLVAIGAYMIGVDLARRSMFTMLSGSIGGVFLLVVGLVIAFYPNVLNIIPVILGIWLIVSAAFSARFSAALRSASSASFWASLLTALVSITCGILLIVNPTGSTVVLTQFIGVVLMVYAVSSLVELIIFRRNLSNLAKYFKAQFKPTKVIDGKVEK